MCEPVARRAACRVRLTRVSRKFSFELQKLQLLARSRSRDCSRLIDSSKQREQLRQRGRCEERKDFPTVGCAHCRTFGSHREATEQLQCSLQRDARVHRRHAAKLCRAGSSCLPARAWSRTHGQLHTSARPYELCTMYVRSTTNGWSES